MSYCVYVLYSSPDGPDITFSDVMDPDDWSCDGYWDDLGDCISALIRYAERKLSKLFPHGHTYKLYDVHYNLLEDVEE